MPRPAALDDHRLIRLVVHNIPVDFYGRDFADRHDYAAAWTLVLATTLEERQGRL